MMIQAFLFLFFLTGVSTSNSNLHDPEDDQLASNRTSDLVPESQDEASSFKCSSEAIFKKLDLRENNDKYTVGRPVKDHRRQTKVYIRMYIFAILDVREASQMLVSYIWVYWRWHNEHIHWNPDQFCGQNHILVPTKYLWMPDLTIEEMTEHDKTAPSSHFDIKHDGWVDFRNGQVVESTCRMDIKRFPFDSQSCTISFKSIMHSDEELRLFNLGDILDIFYPDTEKTMSDWMYNYVAISYETVVYFGFNQTKFVYTISLRRFSFQYVANFMLPLLFFMCLDFSSFLLSDTGGEKISFKVTMLLSVTLMQLLLNDVLPPSTGDIPLLVIFCVLIFTMMLISLLESIFVRYLLDKEETCKVKKKRNQKLNENLEEKQSPLLCCFTGIKKKNCSTSAEDAVKEDQSLPVEDGSGPQTDVSLVMEKVYEELGEIKRTMTLLISAAEDEKPGCWARAADIINKVFTVSYIIIVFLFMKLFFEEWVYGL